MEYRGEGRGGAQANNLLKSMINHKERYSWSHHPWENGERLNGVKFTDGSVEDLQSL